MIVRINIQQCQSAFYPIAVFFFFNDIPVNHLGLAVNFKAVGETQLYFRQKHAWYEDGIIFVLFNGESQTG